GYRRRPQWSSIVLRMDRCAVSNASRGGGTKPRGQMGNREGPRCGRNEPEWAAGKMRGRRDDCPLSKRRGHSSRTRLPDASFAARLRGKYERKMGASAERDEPARERQR